MASLDLIELKQELWLYRILPTARVPSSLSIESPSAQTCQFHTVTRTPDELSIFTTLHLEETGLTEVLATEGPFRACKIRGPLDLSLTGILYEFAKVLNQAKIPLMAESTYNTDYIAVKSDRWEDAIEAWTKAGWTMIRAQEEV